MSLAGRAFAAVLLLLIAVAVGTAARAEPPGGPWYGTDAGGQPTVRLYFFWTETCPHCRRARPFVDRLAAELPWLDVLSVPLGDDRPDDVAMFLRMLEATGEPAPGVPAFVFCGRAMIGFGSAETSGAELRQGLIACHDRISAGTDAAPPAGPAVGGTIALPLFGAIDAETVSLPVLTVMIAVVDAFNPCAFFVLMFLMSLIAHARQRPRMAVIGGLFVLTSGLLYFAFMAAWLNLFLLIGEIRWVTAGAALIALALAVINIKDYFRFREGVSLGIPEAAKPGLFARMRRLTVSESWPVLIAGTITLAVAANTYELLCTAGFPMLFTRVLTLRALSPAGHYLYLALYAGVYVIPLLGITGAFLVFVRGRKLQESEGRVLKLLSGMMMLGLGLALLFGPEWLSDVRVALAVVLAALAATAVIVLVVPRQAPT